MDFLPLTITAKWSLSLGPSSVSLRLKMEYGVGLNHLMSNLVTRIGDLQNFYSSALP